MDLVPKCTLNVHPNPSSNSNIVPNSWYLICKIAKTPHAIVIIQSNLKEHLWVQIPSGIHLVNVIMVLNIDLWDWRTGQSWTRLRESQIPVVVVHWRLVWVIGTSRASRARYLAVVWGRSRFGIVVCRMHLWLVCGVKCAIVSEWIVCCLLLALLVEGDGSVYERDVEAEAIVRLATIWKADWRLPTQCPTLQRVLRPCSVYLTSLPRR